MGRGHRHPGGGGVFEPLKRRIQGWVDAVFDRHRYDYRKALVEFGRGLSSETDLNALLESIVERLPRTLLVARVAVFLAAETGRLRLAAAHGLPADARMAFDSTGSGSQGPLALEFLNFDREPAHTRTFFSRMRNSALHLSEERTAHGRAAGSELLSSVPGAGRCGDADHRGDRAGPDGGRRLPFQRGRGDCWSRWPATSASHCRTPACTRGWSRRSASSSG